MAPMVRNRKNLWSGLLFIAFGLVFAIGAQQYPMGTAVRMGPAYFPTMLGWLSVILGLIVLLQAFTGQHGDAPDQMQWRPITLVLGSVVVFGVLINTGGLIAATVAQIILSALGGHEFKWREAIASSIVLSVTVWLMFDVGLGLPFKLFPWS